MRVGKPGETAGSAASIEARANWRNPAGMSGPSSFPAIVEGRQPPFQMKEAANRGGLQYYAGLKRAGYAAYAHIATTLTAMRAAASPTACHFGL